MTVERRLGRLAAVAMIMLASPVHQRARAESHSLAPFASLLAGTGFHGDAGFEVMDWNYDGRPDLFVYDTGSVGTGWIYFNEGAPDAPRFTHGVQFPYNSTETTPQTIEHLSARAFGDLNHDGLLDFIFFDGQLRYCPNTGRKQAPFLWTLWPQAPAFFPGTPRMIAENSRYSTGPESIYWNKGIFARQVLTLTVADWDGDGLVDLLICRMQGEAPGVVSLGGHERWTNWGRLTSPLPAMAAEARSAPQDVAPLIRPPARGLFFYKNVGSKTQPLFGEGIEILTTAGRSIAAPNPVVFDVDGDGVLDVVSSETRYSCNSFRVDWPTLPNVVWFRRPAAVDPARLQHARVLGDRSGKPIRAGTLARFADIAGNGRRDLLVSDAGYGGRIRWYRNASPAAQGVTLQGPITLSAADFGRFEFMDQPLVANWYGRHSRDLILHGVTDAHCKWGLRRTALYRNVAKRAGETRYEFAGLLNFRGDPAMVPVSSEERPYEVYGSSVSFARGRQGETYLMMSVGGKLFLFSDLAADGLAFQTMQPIDLHAENNRHRGWQELPVTTAEPIKAIRISNDPMGRAHLSDHMLHLVTLQAIADGKNVATRACGARAERVSLTDKVARPLENDDKMLAPANGNTDDARNAAMFGRDDAAVITLGAPARIEKIRFLLAGRDSHWYRNLVPFTWQGRVFRAGYERGEQWYQYKVEVSTDGAQWNTVVDRTSTEMLYSHPSLVDWDGDGRLDLLLYYTSAHGIWPAKKTLRLYRNVGSDDRPRYAAGLDAVDEHGKTLTWPASWARTYSPQCGLAVADLDGSHRREVIVEGPGDGLLLRFKRADRSPAAQFRVESAGSIMMEGRPYAQEVGYWYFDVADADGDGVPDLIESNNGRPAFHKGLRRLPARPQLLTPEPPSTIALRNGPAAPGTPPYGGNTAATLGEQGSLTPTTERPYPRELEFRAQQPDGSARKVTLLRFADLPATPVASAVLVLSTDPALQSDPSMLGPMVGFAASCNSVETQWDSASTTFAEAASGQASLGALLDTGGAFLSFVEPLFVQQRIQRLRWDVTAAVRSAQLQGKREVTLLIRVEYSGPYVSGIGLRVCGPGWPAVDQRPRLMICCSP